MGTKKHIIFLLFVLPFLSVHAQKCKIGDKYYESIQWAIESARADGSSILIEVLEDCNEALYIYENTNIVLNMNGYCLYRNKGNGATIAVYGNLTITGEGTIENSSASFSGDTDYRRAIWTDKSSTTHIESGIFINNSVAQTLCFNGDVVIDDAIVENHGEGPCIGLSRASKAEIHNGKFTNWGNFETLSNRSSDTLIIHNGQFINKCEAISASNDYRRALWTAETSHTHIENGIFQNNALNQTICFNGNVVIDNATVENRGTKAALGLFCEKAIINGGRFVSGGYDSGTVYIYGCEAEINGGTFIATEEGALFIDKNSKVDVRGGDFSSNYHHVIYIRDSKLNLYDANVTNTSGACFFHYSGDVNIYGGKYGSTNGLVLPAWDWTDLSHYKLYGGVYSHNSMLNYVAYGYECVPNEDEDTQDQFPYMVREIKYPEYSLKVTCQNNVIYIKLTEETSVYANNEKKTIEVSTLEGAFSLKLGDVEKMEFVDSSTKIQECTTDELEFVLEGKVLKFKGDAGPKPVSVYTLDGKPCKAILQSNAIDMSSCPDGIYLIKINGRTIKTIIR